MMPFLKFISDGYTHNRIWIVCLLWQWSYVKSSPCSPELFHTNCWEGSQRSVDAATLQIGASSMGHDRYLISLQEIIALHVQYFWILYVLHMKWPIHLYHVSWVCVVNWVCKEFHNILSFVQLIFFFYELFSSLEITKWWHNKIGLFKPNLIPSMPIVTFDTYK
jgi:hypothetical protein